MTQIFCVRFASDGSYVLILVLVLQFAIVSADSSYCENKILNFKLREE